MYWRKGKKHWTERGGGERKESSGSNTKVRGEGVGIPDTGDKIFLQPTENSCQSRWILLKELPPVESLWWSGGREWVGRHIRERKCYALWNPTPPHHSRGWVEELRLKELHWTWERREKMCWFNVCHFVSHYVNPF